MKPEDVIPKLIPPGRVRNAKRKPGGVIQICVTRACDKCCFGCTQGSNLQGADGFMTPEQFEQAAVSLKQYFGIVGVFGGNPCLSPHFEAYCKILQQYIPKARCGLWANKLFGKGAVCKQTFNPTYCNLNVHLDRKAFDEFRRDWGVTPFGLTQDSRHGPPFVAMQDLEDLDAEEMWRLIADCDINRHWSALIGVFRGELRGWFCEIAGAQSMIHQHEPDYPDTGVPIDENWWRRPMTDPKFYEQARYHCPACGVPLRGYGELAMSPDGTEQTSKTHVAVFKPKKVDRPVEVCTKLEELCSGSAGKFTQYLVKAK